MKPTNFMKPRDLEFPQTQVAGIDKDARITELERQLAEATTWRSPETAPRDGTHVIGRFALPVDCDRNSMISEAHWDDSWCVWDGGIDYILHKYLTGWLPLPETKKEDVP